VAEGVKLSGRRKAAILCVSLGPATAAEIFRHLSEDILELLTVEMAKTPWVDPAHAEAVLGEVVETAEARGYIAEGGLRYARDVLERAVGPARASEILSRLATVIESTPFEFLQNIAPEQIYAYLRNESPQTIALVLANAPRTDLAAQVMQLLPGELQADVATRIATLGQTNPDVVKEVARVMEEKLENVLHQEYAASGGIKSVAQIINAADRTTERNILERLQEENQWLADEVRKLLFVFEDLMKLDDRSVQLVLKEVDQKDLALALRGASDDVRDKVLSNMSERGSEMLLEEIEIMPPQRRSTVEEAQSKIVAVVRRLEETGAIFLVRGGDEDDLVL
jgi:flagellar motor switch protein FliG